MEDKKLLTKGQKCSLFVREIFDLNLEERQTLNNNKNIIFNKYINLKIEFPDEPIENTIIKMLYTNNNLLSNLNKDKDLAKEVIKTIFQENSGTKDFKDSLNDFINFCHQGGNKDAFENYNKKSNMYILEKEREIGELHKSGVLDFNFVRNKLSAKTEFWKIKEAVAWLVCYSEKISISNNDIIIKNEKGFIDKDSTFDNLIEKINSASLTKKNPFEKVSNQKRFGYKFNDAQSGEVDVMLWDERRAVVVASSATRDRGVEVEGNQFFRHMIKASILSDTIKKYIHSRIINEPYEKRNEAMRYYYKSKNIQNLIRSENFNPMMEQYIKNSLESSYSDKNHPIYLSAINGDQFTREMITHRNFSMNRINLLNKAMKDKNEEIVLEPQNLHNNDYNVSKKEMLLHMEKMNGLVDYVYYGETASEKDERSLLAGLNTIAYRDNIRNIGRFKIDSDASQVLMDNITKRFNGVSHSTRRVEKKAHEAIFKLFVQEKDKHDIADFITKFSKTNVSREERECLYGTFSVLFNTLGDNLKTEDSELNNIKDIKKLTSIGVVNFFGSSLSRKEINQVVDVLLDKEKVKKVIGILDKIQGNNSEVSKEFFKMESNYKYFDKSKDNLFSLVEKSELKNENDLLLDEKEALLAELKELKSQLKVDKTKKRNYKIK